MLCQNCGKNEVTFKYTQVINGVKKELNLCDKCAQELGLKDMSFSMPMSFSSFLGDFFNDYTDNILPSFMGTKELQCRNCGTTFDDFLNSGMFGCDECYDTFEDRIDTVHIFSRQVEYSEDNMEALYESFLFDDVFETDNLCKLLWIDSTAL